METVTLSQRAPVVTLGVGAEHAAEFVAIELDGILAIAQVRKLASFAQLVNVGDRAAEQASCLRYIQCLWRRGLASPWHTWGT